MHVKRTLDGQRARQLSYLGGDTVCFVVLRKPSCQLALERDPNRSSIT